MTVTRRPGVEGEARAESSGKLDGNAEVLRKLLTLDFENLPEAVLIRLDREVLRKILTLRFGDLPESAITRVSTATRADLDRWLERVVTAHKLEDVLDS